MGARTEQIYAQVLREGLKVAGLGILIGHRSRPRRDARGCSFLFGVSATDPLTFSVVRRSPRIHCRVACLVPAYRATRVDPAITMVAD